MNNPLNNPRTTRDVAPTGMPVEDINNPEDVARAAEAAHTEITLEGGHPFLFRLIMAIIAIGAVALIAYSFSLGIGSFASPKSGLWPVVIGVLILIATPFAYLYQEQYEVFNRERVGHTLAMMGGLIAFPLVYMVGGYVVAGFVSMVIITRFSASESWRNTLLIAILGPVITYLFFGLAFQVPLALLPDWAG